MTENRYPSRSAAVRAMRADQEKADQANNEAAGKWVAEVAEVLQREDVIADPTLRRLALLHGPVAYYSETRLRCNECYEHDDPHYDRAAAPWPCATMRVVIEGLPAAPPVPEFTPVTRPDLADYWTDPTIPVVLAYHCSVWPTVHTNGAGIQVHPHYAPYAAVLRQPGDTTDMPLSLALHIRGALDTDTQARIKALS